MLLCKYCMQNKPIEFLECNGCGECVHPKCLKGCKLPGGLLGDVFFAFTCGDCSVNGVDYVERDKVAWVDVLLLTLYNLTQTNMDQSCYGYFHCHQHIKKFINTHWHVLFPHMKTKRKSWKQMITTTLKSFCPDYFLCGDGINEFPSNLTGWYKLARPDILPNFALLDRKGKRKKKKIETSSAKFNYFSEESICCESSEQETDQNGRSLSTLNILCSDNSSVHENMYSRSYVKPTASLSKYLFAEDDKAEEIDVEVTDFQSVSDMKIKKSPEIQNINISSCEGSKSEEDFNHKIKDMSFEEDIFFNSIENNKTGSEEYEDEEEPETDIISHIAPSLFTRNNNSNEKPWKKSSFFPTKCCQINENEEAYLLFKLHKKISSSLKVSVADIRFHRKLKVRKLRREKNISVFNLSQISQKSLNLKPSFEYRILDRYQHQTIISTAENEKSGLFRTRLLGSAEEYTCFISPFTQRVLKPFIRRDYESSPVWLKLLTELQLKVNQKSKNWIPPSRAPIDFSYVRPQHIPAINSLAQQYFWPGINLSECLQYPDFSCVVLYKKLVVGFAFLVPDVRINEAYISFIFTRPEWRKAGIGTFMLYHLIQTCMGRDITLHVSATNSALFLYQKFGFKVEEFVQDFYERYLPIDSKQCKHAFFLRLSR